MNADQAGSVVAAFTAAYPSWAGDDMTGRIWAHALHDVGFEDGQEAAAAWIRTQQWPPVISEFLDRCASTKQRREWEAGAQERLDSALACDGSGYVDAGKGFEPCPRCNSWMRDRWKSTRWNDEIRKTDLPEEFVRPAACRPYDNTGRPETFEAAREALRKGYYSELTKQGLDLDAIDGRWLDLLAGHSPASGMVPRRGM